jgi:regulator of ribosome biosynthesis
MNDKNIKFNVSLDLGNLVVNDLQPFDKTNEDNMINRAKGNVIHLFNDMFNLLKTQKGDEEQMRDFDKPKDMVILPKPQTILPRSKPVPKPKPLTKWEKYRLEKGLPPSKKKSRMVYSELAGDWVPRWGKGRYMLLILVLRN